jgi:uncharacterized protein YyaL (SSP411 family)
MDRRLLQPLLAMALYAAAGNALTPAEPEDEGGWRLGHTSSPYLRMHADNPVAWYPWGEAAFAAARAQNKPLFISIGYFTCHWCHVMERESFRDDEIAALLNRYFIAVKVDREQRPDVDDAYMEYVLATRGHGGWPMTVWATPEGLPFLGTTYLPPRDRDGQPGLGRLLQRVAELWRTEERRIRELSALAAHEIRTLQDSRPPLERITAAEPITARGLLGASYDEFYGGFSVAPKFPRPARLLFLLSGDDESGVEAALHTLDRMAAGGIHDQLAGGFHRYSTDAQWHIPHFEKMLYDQALVARTFLMAHRRTGEARYADLARSTLDFVLGSMRDARGGFHSALGADSPAAGAGERRPEEGAYYTWTWAQWTQALGKGPLRDWASARYGVRRDGNAYSDPAGELRGRNILHLALDTRQLMERFGIDEKTARERNARAERLLMQERLRRPPVPVDDKIVTAWNGYTITALARAGGQLGEPRYIRAAEAAAEFLLGALRDEKAGVVYRDWRSGERGVPGFLEDYAALGEALLALHDATGDTRWLPVARDVMARQIEAFWDAGNGGFYSSSLEDGLWLRDKDAVDGATLSANGVSIHVLVRMAALGSRNDYLDKAYRTAAWAAGWLRDRPDEMSFALICWPALIAYADAEGASPRSGEEASTSAHPAGSCGASVTDRYSDEGIRRISTRLLRAAIRFHSPAGRSEPRAGYSSNGSS